MSFISKIKDQKKTIGPVGLTLVLYLLIAGPQLVLGLVIGLFSLGGENLFKNQKLQSLTFLYLTLITTFLAYIFSRKILSMKKTDLGLLDNNRLLSYIKGMAFGLISLGLVVVFLNVFVGVSISLNILSVSPLVFLAFGLGRIFQGFEEEFLFRSIFMKNLSDDLGLKKAVLINSLIFSIFHTGNTGFSLLAFINIFLLGLVFSLAFIKTGSVFFPAGAHSLWNMGQANIFGIRVSGMAPSQNTIFKTDISGPNIFTGGDFGIEASLVTSIVFLLILVFFMKAIKKERAEDKFTQTLQ